MIVGTGIDLADVDRVRALIERHGGRFLARVLTEAERAYCERYRDPAPQVAARFAAKEAALKALGTGLDHGLSWQDVEVERAESGAPSLLLHGRAAEFARERGAERTHLSLSHDRGAAIAVVILEGNP